MPGANDARWAGCGELLRVRVRLAHLTGHICFDEIEDSEYQKWEDEYVKVRVKAVELSAALCRAVSTLFSSTRQKDVMLRIQAASLNEGQETSPERLVSILLKPPPTYSQAGWRMDSAQLEAILGFGYGPLFLVIESRRMTTGISRPSHWQRRPKRVRIVSAGPEDKSWNNKANSVQGEMDLWLSPNAVRFLDGSLDIDKKGSYGLATIWQSVSGADSYWKRLSRKDTSSNELELKSYQSQTPQRFCGWGPVHRVLEELSSVEQVKLRVQLAQLDLTNISLVDLCAQELFTALVVSLAGLLTINKTTIVESGGMVRLENATIRILADAFMESGLGTYSDALLCIIPALWKQLPSPDQEHMLSALIKTADEHRRKSEWDRAETLMRWACQSFAIPQGIEEGSSQRFV